MPTRGLAEFREVLGDFRKPGPLGLKAAVVAPFLGLWKEIGAPPTAIVPALTTVAEVVALVAMFQFWRHKPVPKLETRMKVALVCLVAGFIASLALVWHFTVSPGAGRERVVEGLRLRSDIAPLIGSTYSPEEALRDNEYDATQVWTKTSVTAMRVLVPAVWLATFVALAVYLGLFVMIQRRPQPTATQRTVGGAVKGARKGRSQASSSTPPSNPESGAGTPRA